MAKDQQDRVSRWRRNIILILLFILIAGTGVQLFLSNYLDLWTENRLQSLIKEQTNDRYTLAFAELDMSLWRQSLVVEDFSLKPTVESPDSVLLINGNYFTMRGIRLFYFFC